MGKVRGLHVGAEKQYADVLTKHLIESLNVDRSYTEGWYCGWSRCSDTFNMLASYQ